MTKVFDVIDNRLHHYYPEYASVEETIGLYADNIVFVEAPDWCYEGYGYFPEAEGDDRFIRPALPEGMVYDQNGNPTDPESYRRVEREALISQADADLFEALNAVFDNDTSHDWTSWANTLKAFKQAVNNTVNDANYPNEVTYPDYPVKPWEQE